MQKTNETPSFHLFCLLTHFSSIFYLFYVYFLFFFCVYFVSVNILYIRVNILYIRKVQIICCT